MDLFSYFRKPKALPAATSDAEYTEIVDITSLPSASAMAHPATFDGNKFSGGFGPTKIFFTDYWSLRTKSAQLFASNHYARGIIRRLVTNVINTGLHLEATPIESLLGVEDGSLEQWNENVENRFSVWSEEPKLCDHYELHTFGELQALAYQEALVAGDVLVVLRQDARTNLPRVQLINGAAVQSPAAYQPSSGRIVHGVELDTNDRHVAYWIHQADGTASRIAAYGPKTGRPQAWLVYATDRRLDEVRGTPLLSIVLQSLNEIDKYRDSIQRKALINSMLALFIKKGEDRMGSAPIGRSSLATTTTLTPGNRSFNTSELMPGLVIDELQHGEEPTAFQSNLATEGFGSFEQAILQSVAWACEIPPEILSLSFNSNYSASQAAIQEFKLFLNTARTEFGKDFCRRAYIEWLTSEVLTGRINAPGLIEAYRDPDAYAIYGAYTSADWSGHIKPSLDMLKQGKAYQLMIEQGLITRDRASRELTGTKFSKNIRNLTIENAQLADATKYLLAVTTNPTAAVDAEEGIDMDAE